MTRSASHALPLLLGLVAVGGCSESPSAEAASAPSVDTGAADVEPRSEDEDTAEARAAREAMIDRDYPLHGLVAGVQLTVRAEPNPEADVVGWLRTGARVRLRPDPETTPTCATGWYRLYPEGWACAGEGIEVGEAPPTSTEAAIPPPRRDTPLPYDYWFVKDHTVPEYHRLPSRDEQRAATDFSERYREILEDNERRAERMMAGELPREPSKPSVVKRYLDRGFFVAGSGVEVRAFRRFVRSVRGSYLKQAQLIERTGSELHGVELGEERTLPVAWAVRTAQLLIVEEREDGTVRVTDDEEREAFERHDLLEGWTDQQNIGGRIYHVLETDDGPRYLKSWFAAVAKRVDRPAGVGVDEPWVHVDLDQQTLVLYLGDEPRFATLVSSGQEGYETPTGLFQIRRKYIADTMSNLGDGMDDRYSIEDVPWTQYFDGSFALHGAFWHDRFGLTRSHGCVNLAPADAHRVFNAMWPRVPEGWLGVTTEGTGFRGSHVLVTD